MHPGWMLAVLARYVFTTGMPRYENYPSELRNKITARPMGKSMLGMIRSPGTICGCCARCGRIR